MVQEEEENMMIYKQMEYQKQEVLYNNQVQLLVKGHQDQIVRVNQKILVNHIKLMIVEVKMKKQDMQIVWYQLEKKKYLEINSNQILH